MASLFDDIRDGIRDGIELVVDKTEEYSKIGKLKVDILGIKRNIEKLFSELGGRTYEVMSGTEKKQVDNDEEVNRLVNELKELEEKLDAKKEEIKKVKDEKEKERKEREETRQKEASATEAKASEDADVEEAEIVEEKKTTKTTEKKTGNK